MFTVPHSECRCWKQIGSFLHLDGVLLTHEHYDHVGGLDDLRAFCREGAVEIYAESLCGKNDSHTDTLRFP